MSTFVELETATLEGLALDWAAGIAEGLELELPNARLGRKCIVWCQPFEVKLDGKVIGHDKARHRWAPSANWAHCGPLIDSHQVAIAYHQGPDRSPLATTRAAHPAYQAGATVLVAICRAVVASKIGDTVRVPAELLERVQGGGGSGNA